MNDDARGVNFDRKQLVASVLAAVVLPSIPVSLHQPVGLTPNLG